MGLNGLNMIQSAVPKLDVILLRLKVILKPHFPLFAVVKENASHMASGSFIPTP